LLKKVKEIHDHLAKYLKIPESWRRKNYEFKFVECINAVIKEIIMNDIQNFTRKSFPAISSID